MKYWIIPAELVGALPVWIWIVVRGNRRMRRIRASRTVHQ